MARMTYKYHFKKGKETLYSGITKDLEKRECELKQEFGEDGYIKQVGGATTMDAALIMGEQTWLKCPEQPHPKGDDR